MSNFISILDAMEKIYHYQDSKGPDDSNSAFIEKTELEGCMAQLEAKVNDAGDIFSGVVFAHARYMDTLAGHHFQNQNTFVIFPTKLVKGEHIAYDPITGITLKKLVDDFKIRGGISIPNNHSYSAYNMLGSSPPREF